jgi:hypothetical protein
VSVGHEVLLDDLSFVYRRDYRRLAIDEAEFPEYGVLQIAIPFALADPSAGLAHRDGIRTAPRF